MPPVPTESAIAQPRIPVGVWALLLSRLLATVAVVCQVTMLGKVVYDITGSELDLGWLGLAEFAPTALLAPFTGSLADRFDRRRVLIAGVLLEAVIGFALFLHVRSEPSGLAVIFTLVILFGVARAVASPPSRALPVDLAPRGAVERVLALNAATWQIGAIAGPLAGGGLYVVGASIPFAFAAALFVASAVAVLAVPASGVARLESKGVRSALSDAVEGLRFIRRTPVLAGAISLDLFAVLFGGAVALLPAIAEERLGVGSVGFGALRAATGVGAAGTSLFLAARPITRRVGPVLFSVVGIFGVGTIALGMTRSFVVALLALVTLSAADSVSVFIRSTIVPLASPENMRGRVLASESVFIGASNELGAFESGVAGHFLGLVGAVVSGGVGTLAVVVLWWRFFPALRKIDRFEELRPETPTGSERQRQFD